MANEAQRMLAARPFVPQHLQQALAATPFVPAAMRRTRANAAEYVPLAQRRRNLLRTLEGNRPGNVNSMLREINTTRRANLNQNRSANMNALLREINRNRRANLNESRAQNTNNLLREINTTRRRNRTMQGGKKRKTTRRR
jgi:hypothetical protein